MRGDELVVSDIDEEFRFLESFDIDPELALDVCDGLT